jgi:hypothetical protein
MHTLRYCSIIAFTLALAGPAFAGPPPKPCRTTGALEMTTISPAQHSYTLGDGGGASFSFTVSSPDLQITNSCDAAAPVFGNGDTTPPTVLPLSIEVEAIQQVNSVIAPATQAAIQAALSSFATAPFQLTWPGNSSQTITFSFNNSASIPAGVYDVTVQVKPAAGTGVGAASQSFSIHVEQPQVLDQLAPTVHIVAPVTSQLIKLNDSLLVNFTAVDPPEGGAGTGIVATRAEITSCAGNFNYALTSSLSVGPALPVAANVTATSTASVNPWLYVGNFTLTAQADDNAGHTGSAAKLFTAGTNIAPLPPISVPNRQFNSGSTLPVKFTITDANGSLLPPMDGLVVRITAPSGAFEERVPGSSATNVRWEVDVYGNATQYITNYPIPATGAYRVDVLVGDVCGAPALQGGFDFVAGSKGGKL